MIWFDLVKLEGLALWRSRLLALHPVIAFGFATVLLGGNPVDVAAMVPPLTTAVLIVQLPILVLVLAPSVTGTWSQKGDCLWLTAAGLPVVAAARLAAAVASISLLLLPVIVAMGIIWGWRSGDVVAGGMQLTVACS